MLLIIDDDSAVRTSLAFMLKRAGYEVETAATPDEGLAIVRMLSPQLILMDMNFSLTTSGEDGIRLLKQVKVLSPDTPVILITAWGSIELAVEGMRAGAFDFVTKPWNNTVLLNSIRTALEVSAKGKQENGPFNRADFRFEKIIGRSKALTDVLQMVARIAPTNASVLITGESGTGKELIAEAIHANSPRAKFPFVKVNLGGLPPTLFESEMFGHKKGAFTDALADRTGRFEMANKGTIFLDEIGELDLSCQVKLLRVLQDQTFEALGDSTTRRTDVRVVSATNCDLRVNVDNRSFREDLLYRINLISIHLPSLRERREDIPALAAHFAEKQAKANRLPRPEFTPAAIAYLQSLPFPGNIRELKNLVERTLLISGKTVLDETDFAVRSATQQPVNVQTLEGLTLDEIEHRTILQTLKKYDGNLTLAATSLGISRSALYRRMEKYGIQP
ncbi:MAG: sigma-54 dependent transcriptional regulator [Tannerella sp.]|jgi:two-component system NtrC family response regulator|nr:sigma-54 dependent transcriptional regulator [Tannerella sp.]